MTKQKFGFTLAEVLIVIGIIGVVAALTLPNLNHATGDKEKVTKVKKIYSTLTEAFDRAQVIYGDFDTWYKDIDSRAEGSRGLRNEIFAKRVTEFLKVSKDCEFGAGCFSTAPLLDADGTQYDGDNYLSDLQSYNAYMVMLSDGMSLRFDLQTIGVDIDGPNKGKNKLGDDIFDFSIGDGYFGANPNQLYPSANPDNWVDGFNEHANYLGSYSTAWVIENGNLDYLKCPDELNWETKTSCE